MIHPDELKKDEPLVWSTGSGTDVWDLFCACIAGDLESVRRLLEKDPSLARCQHHYRTPIYFVVRENRLEVAAFLLARGADPLSLAVDDSLLDICRDRGHAEMLALLETHLDRVLNASSRGEPVAAAIRRRDLKEMRALLDASPGLLHAGDGRSNQPIHWAVMTRQLDAIDELLARGADIEATRYDGARPLQLANGDYHFRGWRDVPEDWPTTPLQVVAHLRARGAYVDICTACHIGDIERVRELVELDPSLADRVSDYVTYYLGSGTPIKNAAAKGHIEIVRLLLRHGADPNRREEGIAPRGHALYAAAANGHIEIVRLLLEHGADPNPPVESSADALSRALSRSDRAMVELLCSHGAARPVELLAYDGDVHVAAAVFAANPVLAADPAALAAAAGEGREPFVRLMLRYHPDLPRSIRFPSWSTGAKSRELDELLFAHGMSPSQPDWLHVTPLHQFARSGNVERAALYIDHGADLHAREEHSCSTPLGWAAKHGQKAMVELLLARGAEVHRSDDPPWATPLAWATRRGHREIADLLNGGRGRTSTPAAPPRA